jgi:hypothetical protein
MTVFGFDLSPKSDPSQLELREFLFDFPAQTSLFAFSRSFSTTGEHPQSVAPAPYQKHPPTLQRNEFWRPRHFPVITAIRSKLFVLFLGEPGNVHIGLKGDLARPRQVRFATRSERNSDIQARTLRAGNKHRSRHAHWHETSWAMLFLQNIAFTVAVIFVVRRALARQ